MLNIINKNNAILINVLTRIILNDEILKDVDIIKEKLS